MTAKLEYTKYVPSNDVAVMHSYSPLSSKPTIFSYVIPSRPAENQNKFLKKNRKLNSDFLEGELQTQGRGQPIIWPNFVKNCMKMKKIGSGWWRASKVLLNRKLTKWNCMDISLQTFTCCECLWPLNWNLNLLYLSQSSLSMYHKYLSGNRLKIPVPRCCAQY